MGAGDPWDLFCLEGGAFDDEEIAAEDVEPRLHEKFTGKSRLHEKFTGVSLMSLMSLMSLILT